MEEILHMSNVIDCFAWTKVVEFYRLAFPHLNLDSLLACGSTGWHYSSSKKMIIGLTN